MDSDKKVATGQALGIEFEVAGTSKVEVISGTLGPPNYGKKAEIKFANDLRVELETADDETSATFRLNGKDFGILKRGDKVLIDGERHVTVNDEKRTATESPSE